MVALWEVGGSCGRVVAEEQTNQASLIFLFRSVFIFYFFNNSLSLSSFLVGKKLDT